MTTPEERLDGLLEVLSQIRDFLASHGMAKDWTRFAALASAASGEEAPARVLRDSWRVYARSAGHRDGIGDLYVATADGGVDREASLVLDGLKDRIGALLDEE